MKITKRLQKRFLEGKVDRFVIIDITSALCSFDPRRYMCFEKLPAEIIRLILSYIDPLDISSLEATSRAYRHRLWKQVHYLYLKSSRYFVRKHWPGLTESVPLSCADETLSHRSPRCFPWLIRAATALRRIDVSYSTLCDQDLEIMGHFPFCQLEGISMSYCQEVTCQGLASVGKIIQGCERFRDIDLQGCGNVKEKGLCEFLQSHGHNLWSLNVKELPCGNAALITIGFYCPHLRVVHLGGNSKEHPFHKEALAFFWRQCSQLTKIYLQGIYTEDPSLLAACSATPPGITENKVEIMSLVDISHFDYPSAVEPWLHRLTRIKTLELRYAVVNPRLFSFLFEGTLPPPWPGLQVLDLSLVSGFFPKESPQHGSSVVDSAHHKRYADLVELILDGHSEIPVEPFSLMLNQCSFIRRLSLFDCSSVTDQLVKVIVSRCHDVVELDLRRTRTTPNSIRILSQAPLAHTLESIHLSAWTSSPGALPSQSRRCCCCCESFQSFCFPCLRSFVLEKMDFCEAMMVHIISKCPRLDRMFLYYCEDTGRHGPPVQAVNHQDSRFPFRILFFQCLLRLQTLDTVLRLPSIYPVSLGLNGLPLTNEIMLKSVLPLIQDSVQELELDVKLTSHEAMAQFCGRMKQLRVLGLWNSNEGFVESLPLFLKSMRTRLQCLITERPLPPEVQRRCAEVVPSLEFFDYETNYFPALV